MPRVLRGGAVYPAGRGRTLTERGAQPEEGGGGNQGSPRRPRGASGSGEQSGSGRAAEGGRRQQVGAEEAPRAQVGAGRPRGSQGRARGRGLRGRGRALGRSALSNRGAGAEAGQGAGGAAPVALASLPGALGRCAAASSQRCEPAGRGPWAAEPGERAARRRPHCPRLAGLSLRRWGRPGGYCAQ